jgi:hypothetical protein
MILLDLVLVASLVHDLNNNYKLFKRQGFWFSDLIVAVLQQIFLEIQVVHRAASVEADYAHDAEIDILDESSGTFKKVPIYLLRTSFIKEIFETFATCRPRILSSVSCISF